MARGLDELIDWLVAETAYCGETGFLVTDFVTAVSRFNGRPQKRRGPRGNGDGHDAAQGGEQENEGDGASAPGAFVDMPLARKAWEWLVERPEILVGRDGSRGHLSLGEVLALLPEPTPVLAAEATDAEEQKVDISSAALDTPPQASLSSSRTNKGGAKKKQVSFSAAATQKGGKEGKESKKQQPRRGPKAGAAAAAAALAADDPAVRPRLYATEQTLWYTLTGHDVDYKKVPLLEWKCLQGIASARKNGILQADLRILVNQDKRSVPKRTDFLAAKGYAIKRTTIARGYRTSMLWLTEFAPVELPETDRGGGTADTPGGSGGDPQPSASADFLSSSKDLGTGGIDFSPEFLTKNLEPVPWRNRWIGDAIEFASFGQTILAVVKAWGVIRVVDLKLKMGIIGQRWQMRTLARACREFVASGILRFVAAMRQDERKLFKDCIKFERDPTPGEWAVYLAAGRRRTPMAELRAKRKKEQDRLQYGGRAGSGSVVDGGGDDLSTLDISFVDEEEEEDIDDDEGGGGGGGGRAAVSAAAAATPPWSLDVPLANLIFETVKKAGIDGITSPEICRATLGASFSRYIFTLVTAMAKPGSQPDHLLKFQLHCEPTRVGKNNAYLFRTLENAKLAERLSNGETIEDIEQQQAAAASQANKDADTFWDLYNRGKLSDLPADELRRLYGFAPLPPPISAEEQRARRARRQQPKPGRPRKLQPSKAVGRRNGNELEEANGGDESAQPKRRRGRPPKVKITTPVEGVEAPAESQQGDTPADALARDLPAAQVDENAEPLPMVRMGEPGSLNRKPKSSGRPKRSLVMIYRHEKLRDRDFLADKNGYKEGAIRIEAREEEEAVEAEEAVAEDGRSDTEQHEIQEEQEQPGPPLAAIKLLAAELEPVACRYNGKPGHLTIDPESRTLHFAYAAGRRGRPTTKTGEPIAIAAANLVGDPAIREAPGGDGQALVLEAHEGGGDDAGDAGGNARRESASPAAAPGAVRPFVFILDDETGGSGKHAAALRDVLVALRPRQEAEQDQLGNDDDEMPVRRRGRLPGKKNKKAGKPADTGPKEFVCETCSGVWKNLLGLQYHQTKARTACNPNYVPLPPKEKKEKLKRRREEEMAAAAGADEGDSSLAHGSGRRELRQRHTLPGSLREDSPMSLSSSRSQSPSPLSRRDGRQGTKTSRAGLQLSGARRRAVYQLYDSESSDRDRASGPRGIAGAAKVGVIHRQEPLVSQSAAMEGLAGPSNVPRRPPAEPNANHVSSSGAGISQKRHREDSAAEEADDAPATKRQKSLPPANQQNAHPHVGVTASPATPTRSARDIVLSTNATPARTPAGHGISITSTLSKPEKTPSDKTAGQGPSGFRMPALPRNAAKLSPFILRSQIMMEIIKYLVDCFDGVFPSDRSLWYAAFRVYTRSFPGEDPPTLNVSKAAVKKLEVAKEIEEHTFGFRDPRGQFIYCRLVARPGTDLFQSATAKDFKQHVQAAYPQPYVPSDFAPSEKDMAILRILDKDIDKTASRKIRGRRPLAPEIEVLNAPFYEQPQTVRPAPNTVLLVGYGEEEDDDAIAGESKRRMPNAKRKAALTGDAGSNTANRGTPKRRKAKFADFIAGKGESRWLRKDERAEGSGEDDDNNSGDDSGDGEANLGATSDNEANIDPMLRTVKVNPKRGNPGLDSLPAAFFLPGTKRYRSKMKPAQYRADGADSFTTFVHFLPPNTLLEDGTNDGASYGPISEAYAASSGQLAQPRSYKLVTKMHGLSDNGLRSARSWPVVTETVFQRHSDASFTMDGFMPSRKALLRDNLPQTAAECAAMLRGNQKLPVFDDTPAGEFSRDLEYCRNWEMSQVGAGILRNPSVAPRYVFLNVAFPGAHYTAEEGEAEAEGKPVAEAEEVPPLRWMPKNLYTVDTIPYGRLDTDAGTLGDLGPTTSSPRKKATGGSGRGGDLSALREKQAQQAKYVMSSRREMTAYPQMPDDYLRNVPTADTVPAAEEGDEGGVEVDWKTDDTCIAAFVVVKTLLGGLNQVIDWGLMMRLFPDRRLSALRIFWKTTRRERQPYIDKFTERFQQAFVEAYEKKTIPPLDFDDILAYDWGQLVAWALQLMRHSASSLPATRAALERSHTLADLPPARTSGWREDFFHVSRSVWNRLQDSASEAATLPIDKQLPETPAEAAAEAAVDTLRHMVARSWIRALCGTPHERYQPSRIKQKLLTLGKIDSSSSSSDKTNTLNEADTNSLLQTVISNLTNDRILRRTKSMMSLGGRMYTLTEAYESTLEKTAMEDKFRQAWAFKAELDACFRGGGKRGNGGQGANQSGAYDIPVDTNDDGLIMALTNLQAHGRVAVEAIDAPHIPFGFEPGNYESRKFPKHYQRFRQRIVPTEKYLYNDDAPLVAMLQRVKAATTTADADADDDDRRRSKEADAIAVDPASQRPLSPPHTGQHDEMPIWRDFFGVLDRLWFAKLAGAVVFSLATRGATPVKQTAAHLRPILEPFEVQMLMDWTTAAGILVGDQNSLQSGDATATATAIAIDIIDHPPNSRAVSEWWWLLIGQMYAAPGVGGKPKHRAKEDERKERGKMTTLVEEAEEVEEDDDGEEDEDVEEQDDDDEDGHEDGDDNGQGEEQGDEGDEE